MSSSSSSVKTIESLLRGDALQGSAFRVEGLGLGVEALEFRVWCSGGSGFIAATPRNLVGKEFQFESFWQSSLLQSMFFISNSKAVKFIA